jgi:hypothetical protein
MRANIRFREDFRGVKDFRGLVETAGSDPVVSLKPRDSIPLSH